MFHSPSTRWLAPGSWKFSWTTAGVALTSFCWVALAGSMLRAQLPVTELTSVYPPGGKQGSQVEVTVTGTEQDDLSRLIFSHPGITAEQKTTPPAEFQTEPQPVNNQFLVTIAGDVPPGVYEARVVGRFGVSNPRAFAVGGLEELLDDGANKQLSAAREIPLGTVVNGRVDANSLDYYKLSLKAGQRVLADCWAKRIDSRMDAALILYDAQGREITRNRDLNGNDPLLDFTVEQDGDYVVAIYDFLYGGGAEHFYRLMLHAGPHVDFIFPPAGLPGSQGTYTVYGRNLPQGKPAPDVTLGGVTLEQMTVTIPVPQTDAVLQPVAGAPPRLASVDAVRHDLPGFRHVLVGLAAAPVISEQQPNDQPGQAQQITIPCEYVGQFYPERDRDWVQFEAKQGEVYSIDVVAHQAGLRCDPYFTLQQVTRDDQGQETVKDLVQVDDPADRNTRIGTDFDTSTDDPSYRFQVPADGTYRIMVRDQFGDSTHDPRLVYRLRIVPPQPDFRLVVWPEQIKVANANQVLSYAPVLRQGGTLLLKLEILRSNGFTGEVSVQVEGLPEGVSCDGAILSEGTNSAWLVFSAAEDAKAWTGPIRIVGKGQHEGQEISRGARSGSLVWGTANRTTAPAEFRLTDDLLLSVIDRDRAPGKVVVGDGNVLETSLGGKLDVPVKVARYGEFKEELKLVATGVPAEIKPADVTIKGDQSEGTLSLQITNANAKPGSYTFFLRSDTKYPKWERNPDAIQAAEMDATRMQELVAAVDEEVKKATAAAAEAVKKTQAMAAEVKTAEQAKANADKQLQEAQAAEKKATEALTAARQAAEKEPENKDLAAAAEAAQKIVQEAAEKLKAAQEQSAGAEKKLAEVQQAAEAVEKAKAAAEQQVKDLQERAKRAAAAKTAADKKRDDIKKANAAKDVNIALASTPVRVRITSTPIQIGTPDKVTVKQEGQVEVPVTIERKYGFDDAVELTFQPPKGVAGLSAAKLTVAKGQNEGKLELKADKNAPVGDHSATLEGQLKFNNVAIKTPAALVVQVEQAAEAP